MVQAGFLISERVLSTLISSFIASGAPLLLLFSTVCDGLVETCEGLQAAFDLTKNQDVVIEVHPFVDIDCVDFTTMSMDSNKLTVESSEDLDNFSGNSNLRQIRFEVTNGAKLYWETNVHFHGTDTNQDVNGGAVFVGEGSTVRFFNDLEMTDVGVRSVPEEGFDFASYQLSGGCVYADGYFRVDGDAIFTSCEVAGGGEASPGPGGALYVGERGSVLISGALEISDVSITDDEGNNGGGVYNKGKVNLKGDSKFDDLRAASGGAIYNAAGALFKFRNGASALFTDCSASDGFAGALYNQGFFKFSGQAVFVNTDAPSVFVGSTGRTVLSENSSFGANSDTRNPAILVFTGGELVIPDSVSFVENNESECSRVYYTENETCL